LATNELYCSTPNDFNDPWDCRPFFNESQLDQPEVLEQHMQWFERVDRKHWPKPEAEHRRMAEAMRREPQKVREMVKEISAGIGADIDKRYGVCCFTTKPDSILMWSHYADNHKGICVEFGTNNEVVCGALKVHYADEYPFLDLTDNSEEQNLLPLISKSTDWAYEDEYRLVAQERGGALGRGTLMMDDHLLQLPVGAITSVIMGCSMPEPDHQHLHEVLAQTGSAIKINRAVRVPDHYRLRIEEAVV
jgi:hypothetical protein